MHAIRNQVNLSNCVYCCVIICHRSLCPSSPSHSSPSCPFASSFPSCRLSHTAQRNNEAHNQHMPPTMCAVSHIAWTKSVRGKERHKHDTQGPSVHATQQEHRKNQAVHASVSTHALHMAEEGANSIHDGPYTRTCTANGCECPRIHRTLQLLHHRIRVALHLLHHLGFITLQ